ncbi:response regulator [Chloroflexota bacterium]
MSSPNLTTTANSYTISKGIKRYLLIPFDTFIVGVKIMDKLLSTNGVAEYLNMAPLTIRRKVKDGEIPSIRIGNRLRFDKQQIDKWLLERSSRGPVQILVVDDEHLIGQLFKDSLNEFNYQVTTTLSSLEALGLLNARHFDLIFLDLLMPEVDGAELFRRIRQMDKSVPVAIITGYPDSDLMKRAMEHGPFTVMKKPFTGDDIVSTVRSFVDGVTTRSKT